jgi:hypothetical protein
LNLLEFHEPEAADDDCHDSQHEEHSFHHGGRYRNFLSSSSKASDRRDSEENGRCAECVSARPADSSASCRIAGTALTRSRQSPLKKRNLPA